MQRAGALVAVGSNGDDPEREVVRALVALARSAPGPVRASGLWRSAPAGAPSGSPEFVNAVVAVPVGRRYSAPAFLRRLQRLEGRLGRRRPGGHVPGRPVPGAAAERLGRRNAPRRIDLDLVLFRGRVLRRRACVVPHPRALARPFVRVPAAEAAPGWQWPAPPRGARLRSVGWCSSRQGLGRRIRAPRHRVPAAAVLYSRSTYRYHSGGCAWPKR